MMYKIVNTDNLGRDYPDESFVNLPSMNHPHAKKVCEAINDAFNHPHNDRYYKVVPENYVLKPGFEP